MKNYGTFFIEDKNLKFKTSVKSICIKKRNNPFAQTDRIYYFIVFSCNLKKSYIINILVPILPGLIPCSAQSCFQNSIPTKKEI